MKTTITLIISLLLSLSLYAQNVEKDGKTYEVKNDKIFLDGVDVTKTLSDEASKAILLSAKLINENRVAQAALDKLKKKKKNETDKLEKDKNKAEKAQKKAEKALKTKEKAQKRFESANKKLESAKKKYDKLKKKGQLSPKEDSKWIEKLENLKKALEKAKRKL